MQRKGRNEFVIDSSAEFDVLSIGVRCDPTLQGERFEEGVELGSTTSYFTYNNAYLPFVKRACYKAIEVSPKLGGRQTRSDAINLLYQSTQILRDIDLDKLHNIDVNWDPIPDDELARWSDIDGELELLRNTQ